MSGTALNALRRMRAACADALYPPVCPVCQAPVGDALSLCAECWSDTRLIGGAACDACARPLRVRAGEAIRCDDCVDGGFVWERGRAAALYGGGARSLVLAFKHGDRPDIADLLVRWMARAGADILGEADLVVPVPLHWTRFLRRRYNQAAELSRRIAGQSSVRHDPGALRRVRRTPMQRARSRVVRRRNVEDAFAVPMQRVAGVRGARIVLIDDVMTTGATLDAAAQALRAAGAARVDVLVFARAGLPRES